MMVKVLSYFASMQSTLHQGLEDPPVFDTIYCRKRSMISNAPSDLWHLAMSNLVEMACVLTCHNEFDIEVH